MHKTVKQMQLSPFAFNIKGAWALRFADIMACAMAFNLLSAKSGYPK